MGLLYGRKVGRLTGTRNASRSVVAEAERRPTIQFVEDEPDLVLAFRLLVEAMGFQLVRSAGDGGQGLNQLRHFRPDLIVTGLGMPNVTGFEFIERVRATGGPCSTIPIVVWSTRAACPGTVARVMALGADRVLDRLVDWGELVAALAAALPAGLAPRPDIPLTPTAPCYQPDPTRWASRIRPLIAPLSQLAGSAACQSFSELAAALAPMGPLASLGNALAAELRADAEDDAVLEAAGVLGAVASLDRYRRDAARLAPDRYPADVLRHASLHWPPLGGSGGTRIVRLREVDAIQRAPLVLDAMLENVAVITSNVAELTASLDCGVWEPTTEWRQAPSVYL